MLSADTMPYDETQVHVLDGEIRAAAFRLGKVVEPVQQWLEQQEQGFNLLTATPEEARHMADVQTLLEVMAAYCAAADAVNVQLRANLVEAEETMHREATRASFMAQQFKLTHDELLREKQASTRYLELAFKVAGRRGGASE